MYNHVARCREDSHQRVTESSMCRCVLHVVQLGGWRYGVGWLMETGRSVSVSGGGGDGEGDGELSNGGD